MNRPHAVGTLMVRLEDTNGRAADSDNSTGASAMDNTGSPARRKWWQLTGNKEDRFIWQGTCGKGEEILYKPNFDYGVEQDSPVNSSKQGIDENMVDNDLGVGERKKRVIDQRMNALSSLFSCHHSNGHRDNSSVTRATNLTDDAFADIVLNQTYSPQEEEEKATISEPDMKYIIQKYQDCRQEKRNLANTYIADRRTILPEPWIERDEGEQSSVQIDRHGRLVRIRRESNNEAAAENDDHASESSNDEQLELVDAAGEFWRQYKNNKDASRGNTRRGSSTISNATAPGIQRPPQQPPPLLQPLPQQNPLNQQHIRERRIAQQMENESRQAIERAIHRYRGQQQQQEERDEAVFEMVNIPLIRPINETNVPRWLRFLSFNRHQRHHQQHQNNNNDAAENPNQLQNDPNEQQQDHQNNGERGDELRLALRRICFAVITVAAAFICMMLEGLPLVDFGDDVVFELNPTFLSGLMGPHYPGHHPQPRDDWFFPEMAEEEEGDIQQSIWIPEMAEEEEGDIQQSIWNRLGVEDGPRDIAPEGAGQSSNQGGEEL